MRRYKYRDVFFATYRLGPWTCYFCHSAVEYGKEEIHHLNNDHANCQPENLVAAHRACHRRFHFKAGEIGKIQWTRMTSEERSQELTKRLKKRWSNATSEEKRRISTKIWETRRRNDLLT